MTMNIINTGRQRPKGVKLTTTGATAIMPGPPTDTATRTLESLCYSCAASTTLSIWLTDGTISWYILNGETIAANSHAVIDNLPLILPSGWSLVAQAAEADRIDIIAIFSIQQD